MNLLLDTHLLLWICFDPSKVPSDVVTLVNGDDELFFSAASIWEIGIKHSLGRPDFPYDPRAVRKLLVDAGYQELGIVSDHGIAAAGLPVVPGHKDPFDRVLIAQALVEGMTLLTSDAALTAYSAPIRHFP